MYVQQAMAARHHAITRMTAKEALMASHWLDEGLGGVEAYVQASFLGVPVVASMVVGEACMHEDGKEMKM